MYTHVTVSLAAEGELYIKTEPEFKAARIPATVYVHWGQLTLCLDRRHLPYLMRILEAVKDLPIEQSYSSMKVAGTNGDQP